MFTSTGPVDAADAERIHAHRATREREAGVLLSTLRTRIRQALAIGERKLRCRELAKIERAIGRIVWPLSLAADADNLAAEVHDAASYGGIARLQAFVGPEVR